MWYIKRRYARRVYNMCVKNRKDRVREKYIVKPSYNGCEGHVGIGHKNSATRQVNGAEEMYTYTFLTLFARSNLTSIESPHNSSSFY